MTKDDQIKLLMTELTAITGLGANCINLDNLKVIDGTPKGKFPDTHYCPDCPLFGLDSCIPYWLKQPSSDGLIHCPGKHSFAHTQLLNGDLVCGLLMLGPLPQGLIKNHSRLAAMHTLLQSFACLMEKRALLPQRNDAFAAISRYIASHLTDDLSMETLQANLYLSASTISRVVKHESGIPLRLYIQSHRLEAARRLLLTTNLSIIQIAEQCGVNDFNYFSRIFKKQYGMSPSVMRLEINGGR